MFLFVWFLGLCIFCFALFAVLSFEGGSFPSASLPAALGFFLSFVDVCICGFLIFSPLLSASLPPPFFSVSLSLSLFAFETLSQQLVQWPGPSGRTPCTPLHLSTLCSPACSSMGANRREQFYSLSGSEKEKSRGDGVWPLAEESGEEQTESGPSLEPGALLCCWALPQTLAAQHRGRRWPGRQAVTWVSA